MREIRPSGSEGGARSIPCPYPYRRLFLEIRSLQRGVAFTLQGNCQMYTLRHQLGAVKEFGRLGGDRDAVAVFERARRVRYRAYGGAGLEPRNIRKTRKGAGIAGSEAEPKPTLPPGRGIYPAGMCEPPTRAGRKSGRGLPQSKTLRDYRGR